MQAKGLNRIDRELQQSDGRNEHPYAVAVESLEVMISSSETIDL